MICNLETATAKIASVLEGSGVVIDAEAFKGMSMEGKAAFAKNSNKYDTALAEDVALRNKNDIDTIASGGMKKLFGDNVGSWLTLSKDPGVILGEDFIKPLQDALQSHAERFPNRGHESIQAYKDEVLPVIKDLQSKVQDHFEDPGRLNYANRYLTAWQDGGRFYNRGLSVMQHANYPSSTITKNLISNNPFIAMANIFEFMPKALGIYGPKATAQGMIDFIKVGGLKGKIPELEGKAVYDKPAKGLLGKIDIVNLTENPLRGLSYYVGETSGKKGLEAVEKIAFKYRPGREPLVLLDHGSAGTVALMRFGIEAAKMYGQWYKNIFTGSAKDKANAAFGLATFHAMTALQTGAASSIPSPIWGLLSDEEKEVIKELDEVLPINILKKTTGVGVDPTRVQPAGGISLGLGYELATSAWERGYGGIKKGKEALSEEEYLKAGVEFSKAILSGGQAFVPGLNTSVKKMGDIILDTLSGDTQPEEIPEQAGKKLAGLDL